MVRFTFGVMILECMGCYRATEDGDGDEMLQADGMENSGAMVMGVGRQFSGLDLRRLLPEAVSDRY
jgi:hypothetical protein